METNRDLMNLVMHNPILQACAEETRQALFDQGTLQTFESDTVLFEDHDPGHRLIFLLRGALQMGKTTSRGRRQIICCPRTSMCGGLCLLLLGEHGLADVQSLEAGQLLVVARAEFERLAQQDPALGRAAWDSAADCMAHLNHLVTQLSFNKVAERVVTLLLDASTQDGDLIRLTQVDLAASVGTTREVVARCLGSLQSAGLVRLGRARITVLDRAGLRNAL